MNWWQRLQDWREARALRRYAIPDPLWETVCQAYPFLARRSAADLAQLRRMSSLFLSRKQFTGAQGLLVDDLMAVAIAAQACLPVLHLGLSHYDDFVGIVVHPDEVLAAREVMDDDGVVHAYDEALGGEAMAGGPVMLSWHDVAMAGEAAADAYNVVIHEFVHVLDMRDGTADGVPLLANDAARRAWLAVLDEAYEQFCGQVDRDEPTVLDPYGAEAPEEFFAVACEAFFVAPAPLRAAYPALYDLLSGYFKQDPAS